ncbi:ABC transporter substrate-binding protein [Microbacterium album]|uniref:SsuA/THI5-like domain-containing protein n=1 Tax=Microbacterium album TaxID=2053191 RepID=A0A917IE16_9MICO|nr:ABC transporter substrate-binding protein [Microbacterium album]GGH36978.1 hypothetical protein GCM10010921_06510 [Microbacterium album]
MSRRSFRRTAALAGALALATGALSACGAAGAPEDEAAADDGALIPVKILTGAVFFESAFIALEQGFFEEEGLDADVSIGAAAAQQIPQVVSGEVDIAGTGGVSLIAAVERGIPVQGILATSNAVVEPITSGILVPDDSDIRSYADLEGKTVALQALQETTHAGTMKAVDEDGGDSSKVEFVQLPLPNLVDAVLSGQVDAAYAIGPFYPAGIGKGLRLLGAPAAEHLTGGPNAMWFTSKQFIAENQDVVERFQRALTKGIEYAMANPDAIREQQLEHTEQDPEYIANAVISPITPVLDRDGIQNTIDVMVHYGFLPSAPAYEDVIWSGAPQE